MNLDTFFTTLYCFVDDWYKREMAGSVSISVEIQMSQ